MNKSSVAMAALLVAASALLMFAAPAYGQSVAAYRLVSITKWNASANIPYLQSAEVNVSKACAQWLVAGVTGHSTARVSEPLYGSHVKIYDFKNLTAYTNYSTCVAAQPARSISQAWELWKNRVIFSYSGNITVANTGASFHAAIVNATAANRNTLVSRFNTLAADVSSLTTIRQAGVNALATLSLPLDVAQVVGFRNEQGANAYLAYKNDPATEGFAVNPQWTSIKALYSGAPRYINVKAVVIKKYP